MGPQRSTSCRARLLLAAAACIVAVIALAVSTPGRLGDGRDARPRVADSLEHAEPEPAASIRVSASRLEAGRQAIAEAVAWSERHGDYAVVVDKSAYTLYAYKDGREAGSWPVELGGDPVGAKQRQGDQRTPEGRYRVTWRREQGETRFYRALLLDYPNAEDRKAGRTGSHIEIHGMGSGLRPVDGGHNWTLGCIALSNNGMDALLGLNDGDHRVAEGTPVTIVHAGSLPPERYEVEAAATTA